MKVIMSIGNPIKSDDNIGNIVLEKIDTEIPKIIAETSPENFMNRMKEYEEIIIIDAIQFEGSVGEVRFFELDDVKDRMLSTHSIPIELLKKFFPNSKIKIIGIQPKKLEFGEELSDELENKIDEIIENVKKLL